MKYLFYSLLIIFLLAALAETVRPGFVVLFFNMNWLFLSVIICGIAAGTSGRSGSKINSNMIDGVKIKKLKVHKDVPDTDNPDERPGYLMEVLRADEELFKKFGQTTFTVAYPGTIKAFHWHKKQDDLWFIAQGKALVVLYDLRKDSLTYGETQTIPADGDDPQLILIPVGVAHGYKALGNEPVLLFYHTTEVYNASAPDEERIPYDDPNIGFDWGKFAII